MADIFNVQPPAWLQAIAKPPPRGEIGELVGMGLAGAYNAAQASKFTRDRADAQEAVGQPAEDTKSWLQELPQGLFEARMNLTDPLWKVKVAQVGAQIQQHRAMAQTAFEKAEMEAYNHTKWMAEAPALSEWVKNPDSPIPNVTTEAGMRVVQQVVKTRANNDATKDYAKSVDQLRKLNPGAAQKYAPFIGKMIPPQVMTQLGNDLDLAMADQEKKPGSSLGKLMADRQIALDRGDEESVKQYDAAIQESTTNKGRSIYMGQDDQGKPIFELTEGGAKTRVGTPTVAMQTKAQETLAQYENSTQLINWLNKNLTEEHVGAKGYLGEFLKDRTLEQLVPGSANKERIRARTALGSLREGLLRTMSGDTRFSNADRSEITQLLPSSGIFESKARAIESMNRVKEILADRSKVYSERAGLKPPLFALSEAEIKKMYQDGLKSGLKPDSLEFKAKYLTEEEAMDAMMKFH